MGAAEDILVMETEVREVFTITEKALAPTKAFSWLEMPSRLVLSPLIIHSFKTRKSPSRGLLHDCENFAKVRCELPTLALRMYGACG